MDSAVHIDYQSRLERYLQQVYGQDGLIAKLATFKALSERYKALGDDLIKIEPLLYYFHSAMATEVLLSVSRLLEDPKRSTGSLYKFLNFCASNASRINWRSRQLTSEVIFRQKTALAKHDQTIASVMGRRDKSIAHLDRKYFYSPGAVEEDYPLTDDKLVGLANEVISILIEHQEGVGTLSWPISMAEFLELAVDNMVRNLHTGRETNFGVKLRLE
jgi:hypothetical protein